MADIWGCIWLIGKSQWRELLWLEQGSYRNRKRWNLESAKAFSLNRKMVILGSQTGLKEISCGIEISFSSQFSCKVRFIVQRAGGFEREWERVAKGKGKENWIKARRTRPAVRKSQLGKDATEEYEFQLVQLHNLTSSTILCSSTEGRGLKWSRITGLQDWYGR